MRPRFDGYYLSDRQRTEGWHAGVCMKSEYYRYLKLFGDGVWLWKDHARPDFNFPAFLAGVTEQALKEGLNGRHPYDHEFNFIHQTGRFSLAEDQIVLIFRHDSVVMQELKWELQMKPRNRLVGKGGEVFVFHRMPEFDT